MPEPNLNIPHLSRFDELRDFYHSRRILVTGANGFLGTNALLALHALGADLTIFSRRPISELPNTRAFVGDLRDRALVEEAVREQEFVFDLAGISGAVRSNKDPIESLDVDCRPHLSLYQTCCEVCQPLPVVLFCSTRLVYGRPERLPVDEAHPLHPDSIYAAHKITIENYLRVFGHLHGLPFVVVRLTNPYGPHQPIGTDTHGILNLFIRQAAEGKSIRIFGDGLQTRDFIFVDEVIEIFLRLGMTQSAHGQMYNLGGQQSITLRDAAEQITTLAAAPAVEYVPWPAEYKAIETGDFKSDLEKISTAITLPTPVAFADGFARTLEYYRQMLPKRAAVQA